MNSVSYRSQKISQLLLVLAFFPLLPFGLRSKDLTITAVRTASENTVSQSYKVMAEHST